MKNFFNKLFCLAGFHAWRERKNGNSTERVCMRPGCDCKQKMYRDKFGEYVIWNGIKIPVRGHNFIKAVKK